MRTILPEAARLIKDKEGLRLRAYQDSGGIWTIGYGHTGPDVHPDLVISKARAEELFTQDLNEAAADVSRLVPAVTDTQFSALVSFAFNCRGWAKSTLLKLHQAGDYAGAAAQFDRWVYAKNRKLPGLVKRRAQERALYERPGKPI